MCLAQVQNIICCVIEQNTLPLLCNEKSWPRGYKTLVYSQTQNKAQGLAACGHVPASSQSFCSILSLRLYSRFITSSPGEKPIG